MEGDDVLWLSDLGEEENQGKTTIQARQDNELREEFSQGLASENIQSYSSKLKKNIGSKGRKPLRELPSINDGVASRTRSRKK